MSSVAFEVAQQQAPAMTRCACAGVSFEEIKRQICEARLSLDAACARTGCGDTCTACIPDLRRFLASR